MANISSQFKKASELYQRVLQQCQAKEKEQLGIINQFKVGDVTIKSKLKPQLIALHKEMQHYQELLDRAENAFERALVSEPIDLGEDTIVKNKKTGNVYSVKKVNPAIHSKPTPNDIVNAKVTNGGDVKVKPKPNGMATVTDIASTTGLRVQAVAGWADENGVNLSKVAADLKSKKLKPMDFMTAIVGNPNNKYAKDIISKYSQKADENMETPKQEVTEVTTNDWHFKKILQMWDNANSFGKNKIGAVLCRKPNASRDDIIVAMGDIDYKEITNVTDKLHIESVITEKQFKGLNGIPSTIPLDKISKDQKLKIIKSPGNIIDFIVPNGENRNFWQVIGTGKIKQNLSDKYYLEGKVINSPMFKSVDDLIKGIDWKSMEERRRFNEGIIKEDEQGVGDESGMAKSQTKTAIESATNIQQILNSKGDNFDVPAWIQSYLALASDYLHSINSYYNKNQNKY